MQLMVAKSHGGQYKLHAQQPFRKKQYIPSRLECHMNPQKHYDFIIVN